MDAGAGWRPPSSRGVEIVTQEGRGELVSFWPFPNFPVPPGAGDAMWQGRAEGRPGQGWGGGGAGGHCREKGGHNAAEED